MTEQEKREQVNHFLTLFIGECFHEEDETNRDIDEGGYLLTCLKCGKYYRQQNDFYTPNDFHRLMTWMEENEAEIWDEYLTINYLGGIQSASHRTLTTVLRDWLDPANLFEFLKEKRAKWENVQDESRVVGYQHPAAVYLDSL